MVGIGTLKYEKNFDNTGLTHEHIIRQQVGSNILSSRKLWKSLVYGDFRFSRLLSLSATLWKYAIVYPKKVSFPTWVGTILLSKYRPNFVTR